MEAHESYLKQSVVEITGNLRNKGDRTLDLVEINCVFYDPYGQVVLRERVSIVGKKFGQAGARGVEAVPAGVRQCARGVEPGDADDGDRADRFLLDQAFVEAELGRRVDGPFAIRFQFEHVGVIFDQRWVVGHADDRRVGGD